MLQELVWVKIFLKICCQKQGNKSKNEQMSSPQTKELRCNKGTKQSSETTHRVEEIFANYLTTY
jgi:hypothetical protein